MSRLLAHISRRDLLKRAGAASAAAAVPTALSEAAQAPAAPPRTEPLETLTQPEAETLEAIVARLIPTDANGPGAREARAAHYIDRALGGALAASREAYRVGPRQPRRLRAAAKGRRFSQLSESDQDELLTALEQNAVPGFPAPGAAAFFNLVLNHTLQGTFGDPFYGGNRELRRLGPGRLPRRQACGDAGRAAPGPASAPAPHVGLRLLDVLGTPPQRRRRNDAVRPCPPLAVAEVDMATELPRTNVVVVGMGAAGGVAVLPLDAGRARRRGPRSRELARARRLLPRRAAQQLSRLAAVGAEGQSRDPHASRHGVRRRRRRGRDSPDDERRRRHHAALLGAELAAEPVGLQGGQRDAPPIRRLAHPEGFDGRGLAVRLRRAGALLRQGGSGDRRVRPGRQHPRRHRQARQHLRGPARAGVPDAAAARHRASPT